jgi:hypothetical protein
VEIFVHEQEGDDGGRIGLLSRRNQSDDVNEGAWISVGEGSSTTPTVTTYGPTKLRDGWVIQESDSRGGFRFQRIPKAKIKEEKFHNSEDPICITRQGNSILRVAPVQNPKGITSDDRIMSKKPGETRWYSVGKGFQQSIGPISLSSEDSNSFIQTAGNGVLMAFPRAQLYEIHAQELLESKDPVSIQSSNHLNY